MKAIYIENTGGPDVLQYGDRSQPEPGQGEVLVKLAASGVNFVDTYHRSGLSKVPIPSILGSEGAGTVVATSPASNGGGNHRGAPAQLFDSDISPADSLTSRRINVAAPVSAVRKPVSKTIEARVIARLR